MVNRSILQYLLTDDKSLSQYSRGEFVGFADLKRRMFLKAREQNRAVPDHLYHLAEEETFDKLHAIADVIGTGISDIACNYLELHNTRIHVSTLKQNDWQELITYIPPLLLQCAFLHKQAPPPLNEDKISSYYHTYIVPNTRYTALPSAKIPQLDHYVNKQKGLHDLHMHLNGALETDHVWQDYLFDPGTVYYDLLQAYQVTKVKEQLEQESHLLDPLTYVSLLKAARKLRSFFYDYLYVPCKNPQKRQRVLQSFLESDGDPHGTYEHPFLSLITKASINRYPHPLAIEGLMYVLLLREIDRHKNETLACFFHFYLLILGLTNRLLVQQVHQKGFEQFQKHTLNGLRERSEKTYVKRYFQMLGNDSRHIRFLEGRFSPKKSEKELITFIDTIWNGWTEMKQELSGNMESECYAEPELKLIAHFIKQEDKKPDAEIRHKQLRYEVWQKGKVLSLLLTRYAKYSEKVVAIDAAASEFDASPEIFAPTFRLMRRSGLRHFTYHAGEDFYHIVSGLRAIYEAIVFCDLRQGNRIGHATATALSADNWQREIGSELLIRKGEYLDNLVFAYHLIIRQHIKALYHLMPSLVNKTAELCYEIYHTHHPIAVLEKAWMMRQCCPIHTFSENKVDARLRNIYNEAEWDFLIEHEFAENRDRLKENDAWIVYKKYHTINTRKEYNTIIRIDPLELFGITEIELLQLGLLEFMTKKEIVIETLPTSNVRIGFHRKFDSYHLWNWIKWRNEGKAIPPIIVGSDDTGIFATNIYNEYANIYCLLLNNHGLSHSQVMDVIKKLDEDSQVYKFM